MVVDSMRGEGTEEDKMSDSVLLFDKIIGDWHVDQIIANLWDALEAVCIVIKTC